MYSKSLFTCFILIVFLNSNAGELPPDKLKTFPGSGNISDLAEFSVREINGKVEIKWVVLQENHTKDYVIEKSKDGKKFSEFADIACASNDSQYHEYFEIDYQPAMYYRLKRKTNSNGTEYSYVVFAKRTSSVQNAAISQAVTDHQGAAVLVMLKDKDGNEYTGKVMLSLEDTQLKGKDADKSIPAGEYTIVASSADALNSQKIKIEE